MENFRTHHLEFNRGLLSFAVGFIVSQTWPTNSLMDEHNVCDISCTVGAEGETCGCTCTTDPLSWPDDEVWPGKGRVRLPCWSAQNQRSPILVGGHAEVYAFITPRAEKGLRAAYI